MNHLILLRLFAVAAVLAGAGSMARAQELDYASAFAARVANPGDAFVLGQFLTIAIENGQYDQAISTVEQHLIDYPRDAKARLIAARLYFQVGSYELAHRQLTHAINIGTLSSADMADAEDLLKTVEERLAGVSAMLFLTGGVRVEHLDFNQADGYPAPDRTDVNPFMTVGGRVVIDLKTATDDALILQASLGAAQKFGDSDFDGTGSLFTAWMGDFAIVLSKGLPRISPTLRGDYGIYGSVATFQDGLVRQEYGISKRLSVRPSADIFLFGEAAFGWLGASSDELAGEWRARLEAGGTARLEGGGNIGIAARGFADFDAVFALVGHSEEVEASIAGTLGSVPDAFVWQHRLGLARGVLSVPDISSPGDTFDGDYWRAAWDHVLQLEGGNRINFSLSYQNTWYDIATERNTSVVAGTLSYTLVLD